MTRPNGPVFSFILYNIQIFINTYNYTYIIHFIMKNYIYQRAVTEIRIPINEDGKLGTPEIVKKYIQDIKGKSTKYVRTAGEANKAKKKDTKKNMDDLFKMQVGKEEELQ